MRRISSPSDPDQDLRPGDSVRFVFDGSVVRGMVRRLDERAHPDGALGLPYLVAVTEADDWSGYTAGRDYTIRAACLTLEGDVAPRPPRPRRVVVPNVVSAPSVSSAPRFLVGFMREGGKYPQQGAVLVEAPTLAEANALATTTLQAELETDIAEGREDAGAAVMLVNAAEVGDPVTAGILGQVSW